MKYPKLLFRLLATLILSLAPIAIVMLALHFIQSQERNLTNLLLAERKQRTVSVIKDVVQRNLIAALAIQKRPNNSTDNIPNDSLDSTLLEIQNDPDYDSEVVRTFIAKARSPLQQFNSDHQMNPILNILLDLDREQTQYINSYRRAQILTSINKASVVWALRLLAFVMLGYFVYLFLLKITKMESDSMLNESDRLYQVILNSLSEGVLLISSEKEVLTGNNSASKLIGKNLIQLRGTYLNDLFPVVLERDGQARTFSQSSLSKLISDGKSNQNAICGFKNRKNKYVWFSFQLDTIPSTIPGDTSSFVISFVDVTDQIIKQEMLSQHQTQLKRMERLSNLGEMAAGITHEIINPLSVIQAYSRLMERETKAGQGLEHQVAKKLSEVFSRASLKATKIITSMRRLSRDGQADPLALINLKSLIDETLIFSQIRFNKAGVDLRVTDIDDITFSCRETQISQVISNLLNNACDAAAETTGKWVTLDTIKREPNFFELSITDSGSGINSEVQKNIFQPFYTTKAVGKGTGLGLAISKQIIESHFGEIYVDSSSPNTKFVIKLPIDPAQIEALGTKKAA